MRMSRWVALTVAAAVLLFVAGQGWAGVRVAAPDGHQPVAAATDGGVASALARPEPGVMFVANDIGRSPIVVRPDGQQSSRFLVAALLAVALAAADAGGRARRFRGSLELSIHPRSKWWRPVPGGRAPPQVQAV